MAKVGSQFAKYERNTQQIAKDFKMLTIVAKFRQIWSHWLLLAFLQPLCNIYSSQI